MEFKESEMLYVKCGDLIEEYQELLKKNNILEYNTYSIDLFTYFYNDKIEEIQKLINEIEIKIKKISKIKCNI